MSVSLGRKIRRATLNALDEVAVAQMRSNAKLHRIEWRSELQTPSQEHRRSKCRRKVVKSDVVKGKK